ncbi:MAG: metallophosphoesterase [Candidatus Promineifilaceae bacterium]
MRRQPRQPWLAPRPGGPLLLILVALLLGAARPPQAAVPAGPGDPAGADRVFLPLAAFRPAALRFAVIGDYGEAGPAEADVAALVDSWQPALVITTGDNNYPSGAASTIDVNIGHYYAEYIGAYQGDYGAGAAVNRFFPSPGNHDWAPGNLVPYLEYFSLPHNERYYDFVWGAVHFYALDSDPHEPDGTAADSDQAAWLQAQLAAAEEPWQVVYFHHPPYSSAAHGSTVRMQWPFAEWGASAVLAGHDHVYERLSVAGFPYFVNGLGGRSLYDFGEPLPGSQVRYNDDYGAMLVEASETHMLFQFISRSGELIDSFNLLP